MSSWSRRRFHRAARQHARARAVRPGRLTEAPADEIAQLVDERAVAVRAEHVDDRLRRDGLPDRSGEGRRSGLDAHALHLLEDLVEAIGGMFPAELVVERRDQADRDLALRRPHREAWPERRHRSVADVLVDELGGPPEDVEVDAGVKADPPQRLRGGLGRDTQERKRHRVHGARDQVGAVEALAPALAAPRSWATRRTLTTTLWRHSRRWRWAVSTPQGVELLVPLLVDRDITTRAAVVPRPARSLAVAPWSTSQLYSTVPSALEREPAAHRGGLPDRILQRRGPFRRVRRPCALIAHVAEAWRLGCLSWRRSCCRC